jgi:3-oxoacyl-[acyl-carrier protein] reductase
MLNIEGAVAVITGGASGIGLALATRWIEQGGLAVVGDVAEDALADLKSELGESVAVKFCDVTREDHCTELAEFAIQEFGRINLVAPFAGIIMDGLMVSPDRESGKVTRKMSLEQFQRVVDINLTGVFLTIRECCERMVNHNCRGLICLISSSSSLGTAGQINYASTKAAMSVMPKVLTAEFFRRGIADRIRCVAVAPGYVGTAMVKGMNEKVLEKVLAQVPIGRLIAPEEVALLVTDLYKNEALTGDVFFIHGGLRLGSKG